MGEATLTEVRAEFEKRIKGGEFIGVERKPGAPSRVYTTQEMIDYEHDTIQVMREGQNKHSAIVSFDTRRGNRKRPSASERKPAASSRANPCKP